MSLQVIPMSIACDISEAALEDALGKFPPGYLEKHLVLELRVIPEEAFYAARVLRELSERFSPDRFRGVHPYYLSLKNADILMWYHIRERSSIHPWELRCGDIIVRSEGA